MNHPKLTSHGVLIALGSLLVAAASADTIVPTAWKQSNAITTARVASNLSNATGMDAGETILYNLDGLPTGEPSSANNISWVTSSKANPGDQTGRNTAMAAGKVWIVADLGGRFDLSTLKMWNFNWDNTLGTPLTSLNNRGVSQFDVLTRDSAADTNDGTGSGSAINLTSVSDVADALTLSQAFNVGTSNPWVAKISNQALPQAPNNDTYTGETFNFPAGTIARFVAIRVDSSYLGDGIGLGKVRFAGTAVVLTLVSTIPADDATQVPTVTTTPLTLVFNESVLAGSGNVTIHKASDNSVVESINVSSAAINGSAVAIPRSVALDFATAYYVTVDGGAFKDAADNPIAGVASPTAWSFTTWSATPLVAEYFSGNGGNLTTTAADVFGIPTGGDVTGNWVADTTFKNNGVVGVAALQGAAYLNVGNFINSAKGNANGKFRLTLTISETVGNWISLGFTAQNVPATTRNFTNAGTGDPTNGVATIIRRSTTATPANELDAFRLDDAGTGQTNLDGPDGLSGDRTLTVDLDFTPAGGFNGTTNFGTARFFDSAVGQFQQYTYTVDRSFGAIFISEADSSGGTIRGLTLTRIDTTGNSAPTISDIAAQSIPADTSTSALPFTVGDNETATGALVVYASSSNITLVPNANIVLGGSGASRNVTVTPTAGQTGTATITMTVDDGNITATDTFVLTVTTPSADNYASWALDNSVTGGAGGDSDNDGVKNLVEYALIDGGERGVLMGSTITFSKRAAPYGGDIAYAIEISTDLGITDSWDPAVTGLTDSTSSISYTFTLGAPVKNFARLKVMQNP